MHDFDVVVLVDEEHVANDHLLGEIAYANLCEEPHIESGGLLALKDSLPSQSEHIVIVQGDDPALTAEVLTTLAENHQGGGATVTRLSGLKKRALCFVFRSRWLSSALTRLKRPAKNSLADLVALARADDEPVESLDLANLVDDFDFRPQFI